MTVGKLYTYIVGSTTEARLQSASGYNLILPGVYVGANLPTISSQVGTIAARKCAVSSATSSIIAAISTKSVYKSQSYARMAILSFSILSSRRFRSNTTGHPGIELTPLASQFTSAISRGSSAAVVMPAMSIRFTTKVVRGSSVSASPPSISYGHSAPVSRKSHLLTVSSAMRAGGFTSEISHYINQSGIVSQMRSLAAKFDCEVISDVVVDSTFGAQCPVISIRVGTEVVTPTSISWGSHAPAIHISIHTKATSYHELAAILPALVSRWESEIRRLLSSSIRVSTPALLCEAVSSTTRVSAVECGVPTMYATVSTTVTPYVPSISHHSSRVQCSIPAMSYDSGSTAIRNSSVLVVMPVVEVVDMRVIKRIHSALRSDISPMEAVYHTDVNPEGDRYNLYAVQSVAYIEGTTYKVVRAKRVAREVSLQ